MDWNKALMNRGSFLKTIGGASALTLAGRLTALAGRRSVKPQLTYVDDSEVELDASNPHGGRLVAHALRREGVKYLFTICGGHIDPILDGCLDEEIEVIGTRHEQAAAHMAEAWSLTTRQIGVCALTAGPGLTDAITGVANAFENQVPMLVLGGHADVKELDIGALQDINQMDLFESITKWSRVCYETKRIPEYVAMAFRQALSGQPGPVYLEIPQDVLFKKVRKSKVAFPSDYRSLYGARGSHRATKEAAELLNDAEKPVIIAGTGTYFSDAGDSLRKFAEKTGIPVVTHGAARGLLPDSHDLSLCPGFGKWSAMWAADVIMLLGVKLNFQLGYGKYFENLENLIQVDINPTNLGGNKAVDVGVFGDIGLVLDDLSDLIPSGKHRSWATQAKWIVKDGDRRKFGHISLKYTPIHPRRLALDVAEVAGSEASYVIDGGWASMWASDCLPADRPGSCIGVHTGPMGTLGVGVPFALAAKLAEPERSVILFTGDGSFGFNSVEIDTAMRYHLPIVTVVANDKGWGMIKSGQAYRYGADRLVASELGMVRYDKWVEGFGGHGEFVENPGDIKPALKRAIKSGKPAYVNVMVKTVAHV